MDYNKIDTDKIVTLHPIEWVDWVAKFKPILPPYARIALIAGVHTNTVTNVMSGHSDNEDVKRIIVDQIGKRLLELQQAASTV